MTKNTKIYKTSTSLTVKFLALLSIIVLFGNLYLQTFNDPVFTTYQVQNLEQFLMFHVKYPYDILSYFFFIFLPCLYYGFIKGTIFYENGVQVSKGLPFFYEYLPYDEITGFEILHAKLMIAIKKKDSGKELIFTINNLDRVLSILDKAGVPGDLKTQNTIRFSHHSLIIFFFVGMGIAVALGQTSLNLSRFLFR